MKSFLFILSIFLFGNPIINTQNTTDDLWQKAVNISDENRNWIPGVLTENEIVYNLDGEVEETTKREIKFFKNENGKLDGKLIQTIIDGKDVTAKEQKELGNSNEMEDDDESENPFNPELQKNISITRLPDTDILNGTECALFKYIQKTDGVELEGKAWLEKTTGIPLKIEFSTDEEIKDDGILIKRLKGTVLYKYDEPASWYPEEIIHELDIEIKLYFFYTFKGKVENKVTLKDYFKE